MLPSLHCQHYQEFQGALEQLLQYVADQQEKGTALRECFQEVKQVFQRQIATLSIDDIAPESASRWQSLQTEIHKQMRLLETDVMLLLSSRSLTTSQRRTSGLCDRVNTLIQYCTALLQL
ncbi:MAG TPA: heterocyst frequency control protein PatD [Waterburya sp.]|jgi:hypothetical protein